MNNYRCLADRLAHRGLVLVAVVLFAYCATTQAAPPTGSLLYTVSNVPGMQWKSRGEAIAAMKQVSAAAARLRLEDKVINTDSGLVTEYWTPAATESEPNFGSFEWSAAYCVPVYSSLCTRIHGSEFGLQASIGAGIETLEGCSPVIWQPRSGWYWNSFAVPGLSGPYLAHAKKDWTLQITSGSECDDAKETIVTILARRDAYCDDGFDGPSEADPGSPYWVCRNNQSATLQYYTTEETGSCPQTVGNPCDVATGAKIERIIDYEGPGLTFSRTYRSNILMSGPSLHTAILGPNWTHSYLSSIRWASTGVLPERLYRPDGGFISLELISDNVWVAKNGSGIQLRKDDPDDFTSAWVVYLPSGAREIYSYYTVGTQIPYPGWRLTELQDPHGRATTVSYAAQTPTRVAAVTGPFGHSLQFEYSTVFLGFQTRTRLDYILDPAGNKIDFVYDESSASATGNVLTSVIYQDKTEVRYLYSAGYNLAPFQLVGIIDENGDQYASFEYDQYERVKSTQHAGGYGYLQLEYDDTNFTTTVTDAELNQTVYSFQGESLGVRNPAVVRFQDGSAKTQSNETGGQRRLANVTDERGNTTLFEYNDFHRTVMEEAYDLEQGTSLRQTTYFYLNDTSSIQTEIRSTSVTHCSSAVRRRVIDYISGTQLVSSSLDAGYDPIDCSESGRLTTFSDYNAKGQPRKINGPRGIDSNGVDDITIIQYYGCTTGGWCGQLKKIINALGHATSFLKYDAHGRLKKKSDPNGLVTRYRYDLRGRLDTITENAADAERVTDFDYDLAGQIDKITTPDGLILDHTWNAAHLLVSITDNYGNSRNYRYDSRGNRIGEDLKDPGGFITRALTSAYDSRNLVALVQQGSDSTSNQGYDPVGNLVATVDANDNTTAYEYDELNRLTKIVDALNGVTHPTEFSYDQNDNLTTVSAPNGALTAYVYDDLGNLLKEDSPDRGVTLYAYDEAGNRTCKANSNTNSSSYARCDDVPDRWVYAYDALNRVDTLDYLVTPGLDVDYDYDQGIDQLGRLSQVFHESGAGLMVENQYTYDLFGNLIEHRQVIPGAQNAGVPYVTAYERDSNDRINRITYPSGRLVDYIRDDLGQIIEVTTTSPPYYESPVTTTLVSHVTYYPFGPAKEIAYGNGIDQSRLLDDAYRPAMLQLGNTVEDLENRVYTKDGVGNILQIVDQYSANEENGYAYDSLNRLVWDSAVDTSPSSPTYTYDANGNRLKREGDLSISNQEINYAAGSNTMTTLNGNNLAADQAGNMTNNGAGVIATYNAANRLKSFNKSGTTLSVLYNGSGELVKTTAKASCSCGVCPKVNEYFHFLPDGRALGMVQESAYKIAVDWIWLDGLPIAQIEESFLSDGTHDPSSTEITYLTADHLGTPRLGTDVTGQEVWRMHSDAFGRTSITSSGPVVRLRFPGQIDYGYAGIYYNYYRDYDSNTGRYLENDPIGLSGGLNSYGYVGQNPVNNTDPFGLIDWKGWSTGFSLSTIFGATFYAYELESECDADGKQASVTVVAVGPTLGLGLTVGSGAFGTLNISDDRSFIDPFVFNGKFALRTIGASTAGLGASAWYLELGGSHTALNSGGARSVDYGLSLGVDLGVNATQGTSTVVDVEWRSCACGQ